MLEEKNMVIFLIGEVHNIRLSGYITEDVNKQSICKKNRIVHKILGFRTKSKDFNETVDFCRKVLLGQIATSTEKEVLEEIEKEAIDLEISMYYNGFIRNQLDSSTFVEYSSKKPIPSYSWMAGQPNNYGSNYGNSQDCVTNIVNNGLNDRECTSVLNPICQVKLHTDFQLTGLGTIADIHYTLGEVKDLNI